MPLTKTDITNWYAEFTRFRVNRERFWQPKIYAILKDIIKKATSYNSIQEAIAKVGLINSPALEKTIQDIYIDAGRVFGAKTYQMVMKQVKKAQSEGKSFAGRPPQVKRLLPIGYNEELVQEIINYFRLHLLTEAVLPITDTMKAWILKNLVEAQETGMSIQDVADKMIEAKFPKNRAIVIARTETIKAANYGSVQGAKKTGYKTNKMWVAARDNRTRRIPRDAYSHLAMDGVNIPIEESFKVPKKTGGYDDIQQPGAPDGDAGNVIQCFLPNEVTSVNPTIIKNAFESWYNGEIVTIHLSSGNKFTSTINHPVLTSFGWVKAGMLNHTHKLVKSGILNKTSIKLNVNNTPSTFKKVYDSLSVHGRVFRQSRVLVNFYGDAPAGDVNIINMERKLHDRIKSISFKYIIAFLFINAHLSFSKLFGHGRFFLNRLKILTGHIFNCFVSFFSQFYSLIFGSIGHSYKHSFASISWRDAIFINNSINNTSGTIKFFSKFFNAIPGIKKVNDFVRAKFSKPSVFNNNTSISDNFSNHRICDMEVPCNLLNIPPFFIKTDKIIRTERHNYSGFVYTFETDNQMYDVSGIVAKNCRCTVGFVLQTDSNGLPIKN